MQARGAQSFELACRLALESAARPWGGGRVVGWTELLRTQLHPEKRSQQGHQT